MKKLKGFTILELLIVVAILAILAVIAVPNFLGAIEKSKASAELAEINSVSKAAHMYYADNGYYPTLQGKQPTLGDPKNLKFSKDEKGDGLYPKYLSSLPHFSYWYIDHTGGVYHTQKSIESLVAITQYDTRTDKNGNVYKIPYELKADGTKAEYPEIKTEKFEGTMMNPEAPESRKPTAAINMTPTQNIVINTNIVWSYSGSSAQNGATIVNAEWRGKQDVYTAPGEYVVELRVQDSNGLWSDWVSRTISVENPAKLIAPNGAGALTDGNLNTAFAMGNSATYYITWEGSLAGKTIAYRTARSSYDGNSGYISFLDKSGNALMADCITTSTRATQFGIRGIAEITEFRVAVPEGATRIRLFGSWLSVYEVYIVDGDISQVSNVSNTVTNHSVTLTCNLPSDPNFSKIMAFDTDNGFVASSTTNTFTVGPLYSGTGYTYNIYSVGKDGKVSAPYKYSFTTAPGKDGVNFKGLSPALFDGDSVARTVVKGTYYITWDKDITGKTLRVKLSTPLTTDYDGVKFSFTDSKGADISTYCSSKNTTNTTFGVYHRDPITEFDVVVPNGAVNLKLYGYGSTAGWGCVYEIGLVD